MSKKKVLIVDDDANVRVALADVLTEYKYNVIEASNEKTAIEKIRKEKPDLALIDIRLNVDMEGYEVCRQIKKARGVDTKVIVYTGYADAVDATKTKDSGADDYVAKTSDFAVLLEAVKKLI